jgi:bifunctional non-homologous end joining protein LigD
VRLDVEGIPVEVSNLDRTLWPATGGTKGDLVRYVVDMRHVLLPHLAGHPATLHRFPEGVDGPHFFQTRAPAHPPWVRTVHLRTPRAGKELDLVVLDDTASLVWAANISAIELHPYLGTADDFERPTAVVFDLDPGPPAGLVDCARVALTVRDVLTSLGLRCWAKVSGSNGIHVHVPVRGASYEQAKPFARAVAEAVRQRCPDRVVVRMARRERTGRVFIDWSQNDPWKSTVAPYSLRGLPYPTVAAPVTWDEIDHVAATGELRPLVFLASDMGARLERVGDLFAEATATHQALPPSTAPP